MYELTPITIHNLYVCMYVCMYVCTHLQILGGGQTIQSLHVGVIERKVENLKILLHSLFRIFIQY
jgi:hypothetical protein